LKLLCAGEPIAVCLMLFIISLFAAMVVAVAAVEE
jgi:hypothetical protein